MDNWYISFDILVEKNKKLSKKMERKGMAEGEKNKWIFKESDGKVNDL